MLSELSPSHRFLPCIFAECQLLSFQHVSFQHLPAGVLIGVAMFEEVRGKGGKLAPGSLTCSWMQPHEETEPLRVFWTIQAAKDQT